MSTVNDMQAFVLAHQYNFMPESEGKYEPFTIDYFNRVFRLAHRPTSNNCMIKFDPSVLEIPE